ncbi:MAG: ribonuclease H-like domain-containing protein [Candidatus Hadarchaeales archaeon]
MMKTLYLDIETTSRKADEGMIIAIGVLTGDEPEVVFAETLEEEKRILLWLKDKLKDCELIITWYGSGFDIPFLITRGIVHGLDMSQLEEIPMLDLCEWCKAKLLLSSNSLQAVAKFLGVWEAGNFSGADVGTLFKMSSKGNFEARRQIVQHCREDLLALKRVHGKLEQIFGGFLRKNSNKE